MTFGVVLAFLWSLYAAQDGTNVGAIMRATFFAVPAVAFPIALIAIEIQEYRERRRRLSDGVTQSIATQSDT